MTVDQKLDGFIQRMSEIADLDREIGVKIKEIEAKANAECEAISQKAMKDAAEVRAPLLKKLEEYRAEVKSAYGITDGEPLNVVQMLKAVREMLK